MITELSTGFLIGLAGSVHCIGMCGPIAAVLPVPQGGRGKFILTRMAYQAGRIATYTIFGVMMGLIGWRFAAAGIQREVSVAIGSLMVLTALMPGIVNRIWSAVPSAQRPAAFVRNIFAAAFTKRTILSMFAVGLANGFLPCGLVYMAMGGAAASGSMGGGAAWMAGFGLGTLPVMLGVSMGAALVTAEARRRMSRWAPAFIIVLGTIIILRGLNLGIPMVSPKAPVQGPQPAARPMHECVLLTSPAFSGPRG